MIWDRRKLKGNCKIPIEYFEMTKICPICGKEINPNKERYNKTKAIPYIRHNDKFYFIHKECQYILYLGIKKTIEENIEEFSAYAI